MQTKCGVDPDLGTRLNLPFALLVGGYTLILTVDKVLFDTHSILGHAGEDEEDSGNKVS